MKRDDIKFCLNITATAPRAMSVDRQPRPVDYDIDTRRGSFIDSITTGGMLDLSYF